MQHALARQIDACTASAAHTAHDDPQFLGMVAAFRHTGGLKTAHDVSQWLDDSRAHMPGTLQRWMAHSDVIHFERQRQDWLPMFQFDMGTRSPRVAVGLVLIELAGAMSHWEIARWFVMPNAALGSQIPFEVLGADPASVIEAARACAR